MKSSIIATIFLFKISLFAQEIKVDYLHEYDDKILEEIARSSTYRDFDDNGDGKLNFEEKELLNAVLIRDFDINKNGRLDAKELLLATCICNNMQDYDCNKNRRLEPRERQKFLDDMLCRYDNNKDGVLSIDELIYAKEMQQIFSDLLLLTSLPPEIDRNHNQKIDPQEWVLFTNWLRLEYGLDKDGIPDLKKLKIGAKENIFLQMLCRWFPGCGVDEDWNINKEKRNVLRVSLVNICGLNGDLQCDLEKLQNIENRLRLMFCSGFIPTTNEINGNKLKWLLDKASSGSFHDEWFPAYDFNNDGHISAEEFLTAVPTENRLRIFFKAYPEFDLNKNGIMDKNERQSLAEYLLKKIGIEKNVLIARERICFYVDDEVFFSIEENIRSLISMGFDKDKDGVLSKNERSLAKQTLLQVYDVNHNNIFDMADIWMFACVERYAGRFYEFSSQKRKEILKQLVLWYDINKDGSIDNNEMSIARIYEPYWMSISIHEFDKNKDGFFDVSERNAFTQAYLKDYDLNGNGRFERAELAQIQADQYYYRLIFSQNRLLDIHRDQAQEQEIIAQITKLGDLDDDGWLDTDELDIICMMQHLFQQCLGKNPGIDADHNGLMNAKEYQDLATKYLLPRYDSDHNGRLDIREMKNGLLIETTLLNLLQAKNSDVAQELDPNGDGVITEEERQRFFDSLLNDFDFNDNGHIDPEELQAKLDFEKRFFRETKKFPQLIQIHDQKLDVQQRKILLAELAKHYDLDGNGKIGYYELIDKQDRDVVLGKIKYLYPEFTKTILTEDKLLVLEKCLLKDYDWNKDGRITAGEAQFIPWIVGGKAMDVVRQKEMEQALLEVQEAEWLKKYDLNGNGKLDPEERARAEQDAKAGIQAPAIDE